VAGATGLVGGLLLKGLLADASVAQVHAPVRRPPGLSHPNLHILPVDFGALPEFAPLDEAYLALGTTIRIAGSQAAFRAVDVDANLAVARAAVRAGARRIGLVSAAGADARSAVFYNRVKGEVERSLRAVGFDALTIAQPSLLLGDREESRPAEHAAVVMSRALGPLLGWLPSRPIEARTVARALQRLAASGATGVRVAKNAELHDLGR